jgi:hypothetical protein
MPTSLFGLAGLAGLAAGCSYTAHSGRIGPHAEQAKHDEFTCSSVAACPAEAEQQCNEPTEQQKQQDRQNIETSSKREPYLT